LFYLDKDYGVSNIFVVGSYVEGLTIRVPRVPVLGENLPGDSFNMGAGGKGTNQAIASARLGADVKLLACIGDDIFGKMALDLYAEEGVSTDTIFQMSDAYTGVGFVNVLPSGENWITVDMGANMQMTPQHVLDCEQAIAKSNILMTQFEIPEDVVFEAMRLGKRHQVTTMLNPAPARPTNPELFKHVDILTPNSTEVRILLGLAPDDPTPTRTLAHRLLDYGVQTVIVTLGREGALIVTQDKIIEVPAIPIQAVDVTGAGDSFNASLAVHLGQGMSVQDAVHEAVYSGAYTAMHLGVIDGLPTREQLNIFKQENS
jgi:ribokinase